MANPVLLKMLQLKKRLMVILGIYAGACIVLGGGVYYGSTLHDTLAQAMIDRSADIDRLRQQTSARQQEIRDNDRTLALWEELQKRKKNFAGLRIDQAHQFLEALQKDMHFSRKPVIDISNPLPIEVLPNMEKVEVISSNMLLNLSTVSDEILIQMVEAILNHIPGYIYVQSFAMTREHMVTKEVLEQIKRGVLPTLVSGKIHFVWRDIKERS